MTGTLTARDITPGTTATYALGDATHKFTNLFLSGTITMGSGTLTLSSVSAGKILRADGAGFVPSTATFPDTATTAGAYLRADGTNWITSTLVLPNAATSTRVVYATAANTWGESAGLTFTDPGGAGALALGVRQATAGVASYGQLTLGNDAAATQGVLRFTSTTFTPTGLYVADGLHMVWVGAGGVSLAAQNAAGVINFYTGVAPTLQGTINASGQLLANVGSAAAPTFAFIGHTDDGIYESGTNKISWAVGGTRMGNLGLGFSVGNADQDPGANIVQAAKTTTGAKVIAKNTTGNFTEITDTGINTGVTGVSSATILVGSQFQPPVGSAGAPTYSFTGDTTSGFFRSAAGLTRYSSAGTARAVFGTGLALNSATDPGTGVMAVDLGAVTTPTYSFNGDLNTGIWSPGADVVAVSTGGSERLRVHTNGQVWINATADVLGTTQLGISGGAGNVQANKTSGGAGAWDYLAWNSATLGDNSFIEFGTEGTYTSRGSIDFNRVGVAVRYNTTSDQRLKDDIGLATDNTILRQLRVHDFIWKETGAEARGVFAQEAYSIAPFAIVPGRDNADGSIKTPWQANYPGFIPYLISGWQEHDTRIAALEAEVKALKGK